MRRSQTSPHTCTQQAIWHSQLQPVIRWQLGAQRVAPRQAQAGIIVECSSTSISSGGELAATVNTPSPCSMQLDDVQLYCAVSCRHLAAVRSPPNVLCHTQSRTMPSGANNKYRDDHKSNTSRQYRDGNKHPGKQTHTVSKVCHATRVSMRDKSSGTSRPKQALRQVHHCRQPTLCNSVTLYMASPYMVHP
jgi:hypothetical protein